MRLQYGTTISLGQDMLILTLAINWKSKRVLNIEPKKLAYRAVAALLIPDSPSLGLATPLTFLISQLPYSAARFTKCSNSFTHIVPSIRSG